MGWKLYSANIIDWAESYDGPPFHALLCDAPYSLTNETRKSVCNRIARALIDVGGNTKPGARGAPPEPECPRVPGADNRRNDELGLTQQSIELSPVHTPLHSSLYGCSVHRPTHHQDSSTVEVYSPVARDFDLRAAGYRKQASDQGESRRHERIDETLLR